MTLTNAEKQRRWRNRRNRLARAFTETPAMFAETIVNECGIEHARKVARAIDKLNKRRKPKPLPGGLLGIPFGRRPTSNQ